jgi:hypothetical protein
MSQKYHTCAQLFGFAQIDVTSAVSDWPPLLQYCSISTYVLKSPTGPRLLLNLTTLHALLDANLPLLFY